MDDEDVPRDVPERGGTVLEAGGTDVDVRGAPIGAGALSVVLLHGRGQDPAWMYDHVVARLAARLVDVPITWAAPAAPGGSWYAGRVHDPQADTLVERDRAGRVVDELVDALLARGCAREAMVLAGFSQGACLVADHLLRRPGPWAGAVIWTGAAFGPPGTSWPTPAGRPPLDSLPVLLTNADADAWVPLEATEALADVLGLRGAEVRLRVQPGRGHEVADDEIAATARLLCHLADTCRGVGSGPAGPHGA